MIDSKPPTSTTSMKYNSTSSRFNNKNIMSYANRVINNVEVKTDTVRVSFKSLTGEDQAVQGAASANWTSVFTTTDGVGIYPTVETFNPTLSTDWDTSIVNSPAYNGTSKIVSIFGHVVLKQADGVQDANNIQLSIWTKKAPTEAVPNPVFAMLNESTTTPGTSSIMAVAIADRADANNKASTSMTVNVVVPITKGESLQLRIRNSGGSPVNYTYLEADLFCRPIELSGTDKNF